ncbi:MAG: Crp/Fnr family transcriptional regulator [Acidobacteria bacterium]|nr:Crp/Fnr family transcriptional regulator [Acidobacteriota bacterium]
MCTACPSPGGGLFAQLDPAQLAEIDRCRRILTFRRGAVLFLEGTESAGVYCICSGRVKLSSMLPDGRKHIAGVAGPGEALGVRAALARRAHDLTGELIEDGEIGVIPKMDFLQFLRRHPGICERLALLLSEELYLAYRKIRASALERVGERLVDLLWTAAGARGEPLNGGIRVKLDLNQEEVAEMIGVSRRSISRVLAELRRDGVIQCRRRSIVVLNCEELFRRLPPRML